jgi:hypothetical protein
VCTKWMKIGSMWCINDHYAVHSHVHAGQQPRTSGSQFVGGGADIADAVAAKTTAMTPMSGRKVASRKVGDTSMVECFVAHFCFAESDYRSSCSNSNPENKTRVEKSRVVEKTMPTTMAMCVMTAAFVAASATSAPPPTNCDPLVRHC